MLRRTTSGRARRAQALVQDRVGHHQGHALELSGLTLGLGAWERARASRRH